jgi:hypothetical protein
VTVVGLGVDAQHAGHVGALDEAAVQHVLAQIVEFVGEDSAGDAESVVGVLADQAVQHLRKPPDACLKREVPFLWYRFFTANSDKLI